MTDPIEELRRYARDLQSEVHPGRARTRVEAVLARPVRRPRRAALVALGTAVLMLFSNVALAAASDPAVPGDPLYGFDRAYERLADVTGLGGPHAAERIGEAATLVERGRAAEALELVNEAFDELLDAEDAGAAFAEGYGAHTEDFGSLLADLKTAIDGDATGQEIAEIARCLVTTVELPENASPNADPGGKKDRGDCLPATPAP